MRRDGGKASLNEPSRPFTPGDMPRHLFHGNDYTNRPGSSYKITNEVNQAADEFASMGMSTGFGNQSTGFDFNSAAKTRTTNVSESKSSQKEMNDVLSIMERTEQQRKQMKLGERPTPLGQMNKALNPFQPLPQIDKQRQQII